MMLWRAAELMAMTFCMTGSQMSPLGPALRYAKVLMRQRFGMSARKAENGFVPKRIVSLAPPRRNIRGKIVNIFNVGKMPGFRNGKSSGPSQRLLPPLIGVGGGKGGSAPDLRATPSGRRWHLSVVRTRRPHVTAGHEGLTCSAGPMIDRQAFSPAGENR